MGCEPGDGNCAGQESPRHEVDLSAYYIDIHETTNSLYADFLNVNGNDCDGYECVDADDPDIRLSESKGVWTVEAGFEDHPVVEVTWYGAKVFCQWTGGRLPTEAEWEKAAKGAAEHFIYPWGDSFMANAANYISSGDPYDDDTTPVGYYDGSLQGAYQTANGASPYGAYDMVGNVWEWVSDYYDAGYYGVSPYNDPQGPATGVDRVLRSGGWFSFQQFLRTTYRIGSDPVWSYGTDGFRCAKD